MHSQPSCLIQQELSGSIETQKNCTIRTLSNQQTWQTEAQCKTIITISCT